MRLNSNLATNIKCSDKSTFLQIFARRQIKGICNTTQGANRTQGTVATTLHKTTTQLLNQCPGPIHTYAYNNKAFLKKT